MNPDQTRKFHNAFCIVFGIIIYGIATIVILKAILEG
jgi:hypothetical protein